MNNYILVGKIINTFGIKGELKIISNFEYQERVFKKNMPIYIGINKKKEIIFNHRIHKNYNLVLFHGYNNINEVVSYKGNNIYILRSDLELKDNEYLFSDLIGFEVYDNGVLIGKVLDYEINNQYTLLKVKGDKDFYLPIIEEYISNIDLKNHLIITKKGSELIL